MHTFTLLALLMVSGLVGVTRSFAQQLDFNVPDFPHDTPVQNLLAPVLAFGIGPTGGAAFLGGAADAPAVCATADKEALIAPVTATTVNGLFYNVSGVDAYLDATHACYLNAADHPPRCLASLRSTAADCGNVATDAVGPLLNASVPEVATSSAAVLASYLRGGAAQRLKLERSLRRTREVVRALSHARDLVVTAERATSDAREMELLRAKATQYVREVVRSAYDRVMEKYYVLDTFTNQSLGVTAKPWSTAAGPAPRSCDIHDYARRLLWGTESSAEVLLALMQSTLDIADSIHSKTYAPAVRGVQCAQVVTGLTVMAVEDDAARSVAAMIALNTLNASSVWSLGNFELLAPNRTIALKQRQLWSLAYVFAALADPEVTEELVGSAAVAECMRRAALVVPDPVTGAVPPSIYWCLDSASMAEMAPDAVTRRSVAVRESDTAANGGCLWGFSEWDGGCARGDVFDPSRCQSCPPGSVGDGEGHCVCGNGTAAYATLTGGCMTKGAAHDAAGVRLLQANGSVSVSANASVALFSVQLPQAAALSDPSAFLRVNVTCVDGGRGGGTRLLATPKGDRTAACASVVAYERQAERTGARSTFNGTQYFVTYAENLTIAVLGTTAFFGETCRVEVGVESVLRQSSRTVVAGTWTFIPRAEAFTLVAHSYHGSVSPDTAVAPADVPLCSQVSAADASGESAASLAQVDVGVCRTSEGEPAIFAHPRTYAAFGLATQLTIGQRIRSSAGVARDASFAATLLSLTTRTGFEIAVGGRGSSDILWSGTWLLNETPLAVNAWSGGYVMPLEPNQLRNMRTLRLRLGDTADATAFVASEAYVDLRYGNDATGSNSGSTSGSGSESNDKGGFTTPEIAQYDFRYVVLIAVVSVLDLALVAVLVLLVSLRYASYDVWPRWCR